MQMDLWYHLAAREFSDVTERAVDLLAEADHESLAEGADAESSPPVAVDFF